MLLRKYISSDCPILAELFYNTVHTINAKDYTPSELNAWANADIDLIAWNKTFLEQNTIIAESNNLIVGFGNMQAGDLDKLYIHKDYQGKGIASSILNRLEQEAILNGVSTFTTQASITAKSFFIKKGYYIVRDNIVVRNNILLKNFIMEKTYA